MPWIQFFEFNLCCCLFFVTVKEKLTADPESEIATTSLRVSLLCPVSTPVYCLILKLKLVLLLLVKSTQETSYTEQVGLLVDQPENDSLIQYCAKVLDDDHQL